MCKKKVVYEWVCYGLLIKWPTCEFHQNILPLVLQLLSYIKGECPSIRHQARINTRHLLKNEGKCGQCPKINRHGCLNRLESLQKRNHGFSIQGWLKCVHVSKCPKHMAYLPTSTPQMAQMHLIYHTWCILGYMIPMKNIVIGILSNRISSGHQTWQLEIPELPELAMEVQLAGKIIESSKCSWMVFQQTTELMTQGYN